MVAILKVQKKRQASLLLDVMLGIILILIVSYVIVGNAPEYLQESRISNATATTTNYATAISQYKFEIGKYPSTLNDLTKKGTKTADGEDASQFGPWIAKIEKDPWNRDYSYEKFAKYGGDEDTFVVYSKGKNGSGSFNKSSMNFSGGAVGSIGK